MSAAIETDALTKFYGDYRAISNINLEVREGEVFGYLGPNGAGKTTTIRTLLDFIRPTSGSALIFGLNTRASSREIKRRLAYLPGDIISLREADRPGGIDLHSENATRRGLAIRHGPR